MIKAIKAIKKCWNYIQFGDSIRIDAASLCQLRCPVCQDWRLKELVGAGYLKFEDFRIFVDKYENFKNIEISNNGEIFMNPQIDKIIRYAFEKGVVLTAENGVNLNNISDETIQNLVKYQFGPICVSIDGASDRTYPIYRMGGSFSKVLENIKKINSFKEKLNSENPRLIWRFIVFGHNEHELPIARKMAETLNMEFVPLLNIEPTFAPIKDEEFVSKEMGFTTLKNWKEAQTKPFDSFWYCTGLWERIQINWDGRLLGCCRNPYPFPVNVFKIGLRKAMGNKKYRDTKKMLAGKIEPREDIICSTCSVFKLRIENQVFLNDRTMQISAKLKRIKQYFLHHTFLIKETQMTYPKKLSNDMTFRISKFKNTMFYYLKKILRSFWFSINPIPEVLNFGHFDRINGENVPNSGCPINPESHQKFISVEGWVINAELKIPADEVFLRLGNNEFKAIYGTGRPDVARHFSNPLVKFCGFICKIPLEMFGEGENTIRLKIISKNKIYTDIKQITLVINLPVKAMYAFRKFYRTDFESTDAIEFPENKNPLVSIIILGYNFWCHSQTCFRSIIRNSANTSYEVIFVDNGSTDETTGNIRLVKNLQIISNNDNNGFVKGSKQGAQIARGAYLVFLNNDTYVLPDWLSSLLETFKAHEKAGIVGSKLIYPDGKLAEAGSSVWKNKETINYGKYSNPDQFEFNYLKEVDYCSAVSMMIKTELFNTLNGFDEAFSPAYYEDTDLAFRVRKSGLSILYQPKSEVIHVESLTANTIDKKSQLAISKAEFYRRWGDDLTKDNDDQTDIAYFARDRSMPGRVILYVDHCIPRIDKDGASFITFQYLLAMKAIGYKIVFWPQDLDPVEPYTGILQQTGIEVVYGEMSFEEYLMQNGSYINFAFVSQPMGSLPYLEMLRNFTEAKIFYMAHDLHFLRELRGKASVNFGDENEIEKTRQTELELMKKSDKALFFSEIEVDYLKHHFPEITAACIPWIQETNTSKISIKSVNREGLLFVGAFGHLPNNDAVMWFHDEVLPEILKEIPEIKTIVLGSNPPENILRLNSSNFIVTGYVNDIDSYFENASVFISPLRFGAGFKTKNARAMSNGLPVVTTTIGAEGMSLTDGLNVLIADDAKSFAQMVVQLYRDRFLWEQIARSSVEHVANNYSMEGAKEFLKNRLFVKK